MADQSSACEFDGHGGRCLICVRGVHFTSLVSAKAHVMGSKHKKTIRQFQDKIRVLGPNNLELDEEMNRVLKFTKSSHVFQQQDEEGLEIDSLGAGQCLFCNGKQLTSITATEEHILGQKHLKNKLVQSQIHSLPITLGSQSPGLTNNSKFSSQSEASSSPLVQSGPEYNDRECFVCNVVFTSPNNREQHVSGIKHMKQLRRIVDMDSVGASPVDRTVWYRCNICNVVVNSEEQLDKHKLGKKHIVKAASAPVSNLGLSNLYNKYAVHGQGPSSSQTDTQPLYRHFSPVSFENPSQSVSSCNQNAPYITSTPSRNISFENSSSMFQQHNIVNVHALLPPPSDASAVGTALLSVVSDSDCISCPSLTSLPYDSKLDGPR